MRSEELYPDLIASGLAALTAAYLEEDRMLHIITDQRPGEPDILSLLKRADLEILSLQADVLDTVGAPTNGWTHEKIVAVVVERESLTAGGAEARLGGQWIGSTEV